MAEIDRDDTHALPKGAIKTRTVVIGLVVGIPLSLLFLWLAVRGVAFDEVWGAITSANVAYVALAALFLIGIIAFQGLRWRALMGDDAPLPRRTYIALSYFGNGVSNVIPGRPGDVVRGVWLSRIARLPVARGLASVGVDRAFDVLTLVILLLVCLPFVAHPDWLLTLAITGAVIAIAVLVVLIAAWWYSHRSERGKSWIATADEGSWLSRQAAGLVRGMATMNHLWQVAEVVAWSFATWGSFTIGTWLLTESLGEGVNLGGALFVTAVIGLGAAIPSSPGQIGTVQWLAVVSLAVLGVGKADALAFSVLMQAVTLIPITLAAPFIAWWLVTHQGRAAERAARAETTSH